MTDLRKRLTALEQARRAGSSKWVRLLKYEGETTEDVVAAHEAVHGPIGSDNVILRVIIAKPGPRPMEGVIS